VVTLRPAGAADAPRLAEVVRAAYGGYVASIGVTPGPLGEDYHEVVARGGTTVAVRDGEIAGLIVVSVDEEGFAVENVAVDPAHQGAGVGRALLEHAEAAARAAGFASIHLWTHERMAANLALYRRIGYAEFARRRRGGEPVVHLRKPLG
jgi:ribosomal protein S18 acetylase RimI-like enzyme